MQYKYLLSLCFNTKGIAMKQLKVKDPVLMQIAIQQEIQRSEESRYDHKLHGVLLVANGYDSYTIGEMFGQSPTTIQRWVKKFNESGFAGLRDGERAGRPRILSEKQWGQMEKDVRRPPSDFNFIQSFWDGKLLAEHLRKKYKVEIGVRQCQRMFKTMGFRLRKPRPVIANADPLLQKGFKKTSSGSEKSGK
jgi:transposase